MSSGTIILFKVGKRPFFLLILPSCQEILLFSDVKDRVRVKPRDIQEVIFEPFVISFQRALGLESHAATL